MEPYERAERMILDGRIKPTNDGLSILLAIRDEIAAAVAARDAEWGAILLRLSGGTQSEEAAFPCPDEASIKAWLERLTTERVEELENHILELNEQLDMADDEA